MTAKVATDKQVAFLRALIAQVCAAEVAFDPDNGPEVALATEQGIEEAILLGALTTHAASERIDTLKARIAYLRAKGACAAAGERKALPAPGYYNLDGDVWVVVPNKAETSVYAKRMNLATGRWEYVTGAAKFLTERLTLEQAAALGHLHGRCVLCGAELSDPESVKRGIGPVCAKRLG